MLSEFVLQLLLVRYFCSAYTLILNRSGVDLATLPVIGPLLGDDNSSILQKHNGKDQHGGHASNTSPDDEKMLSTAQYFLCFLPGNKMLKKRGNMINSACGMSGRNSASDNYREDGATGGASHSHPLLSNAKVVFLSYQLPVWHDRSAFLPAPASQVSSCCVPLGKLFVMRFMIQILILSTIQLTLHCITPFQKR